ncbi:hypothetical protein CYMTET_7846 [Cymbomonas tetramitiformis]|uniref:Centrosomal protein of 162 kDa n=1 Tax=Cymbomonas tetramitiformis TaxID=36881 RepID=A0AAE0LH24_9CHLO|nr:hypothetical protein CYMTET_7846 [Cymbomonas tetramitiformis]
MAELESPWVCCEERLQIGRLERALEMKGDEMEDIVRGLRQEHDKVRHALEAKLKAAVTASKPSGAGTLGRAKELERQSQGWYGVGGRGRVGGTESVGLRYPDARTARCRHSLRRSARAGETTGGDLAGQSLDACCCFLLAERVHVSANAIDRILRRGEGARAAGGGEGTACEEAREAAARIEELESRAERQEAERQAYASFTGGSGRGLAAPVPGPWGIGGTMNIGKAEQERVAMLEGEAAEAQQRQAEAEALVEEWKERAMAAEPLGGMGLTRVVARVAWGRAIQCGGIRETHARRVAEMQLGIPDSDLVAVAAERDTLKTELESMREAHATLTQERHSLKAALTGAETELQAAQGDESAVAAAYRLLQERVMAMDSRHQQQEDEWQAAMRETRRMCEMEKDILKQRCSLAVEEKQKEIQRFQAELDGILQTAVHLQHHRWAKGSNPQAAPRKEKEGKENSYPSASRWHSRAQ